MIIRITLFAFFYLMLLHAEAQQINNNTSGTNIGNNSGTVNVNNYPATSNGAPNPDYHDPECEKRNCGDICIYNANNFDLRLSWKQINAIELKYFRYSYPITIGSHETSCIYQLPMGAFEYSATICLNANGSSVKNKEGQFLVEKCRSKTVTIKP